MWFVRVSYLIWDGREPCLPPGLSQYSQFTPKLTSLLALLPHWKDPEECCKQVTMLNKQYFSALGLPVAPTGHRLNSQPTLYILVHPDQTDLTFSFYLIPLYWTADILKIPVLCLSVWGSKYLNPGVLGYLNVNCYFRPISVFGKIALSDWIKALKRFSHFSCSRSHPAQCEVSSET